jgi:hypothetical protein
MFSTVGDMTTARTATVNHGITSDSQTFELKKSANSYDGMDRDSTWISLHFPFFPFPSLTLHCFS